MSWLVPLIFSLGTAFSVLLPGLRPIGWELILSSGAFLVWAFIAFRYPTSFSLTRFAPMSIFLLTHTLMIVLPSLYIRMQSPELGAETFFVAVVGVVPLSAVGWWAVVRGTGMRRNQFGDYFGRSTELVLGRASLVLWFGLVGLCLALVALHLAVVPEYPIKALLSGASPMDLAHMREASLKTLPIPGIKYLLSWLLAVLFPFALVWTLCRAVLVEGWKWKLTFMPLLSTALVYATFTLAKAPAAMLVGILFIAYFAVHGRRVPILMMVFGSLSILAIPALLVTMISDAGPTATLLGLARRLFLVPAEALVFYFEAFDTEQPFLHGRSISLVAKFLDNDTPFPTANYIYHIIHPGGLTTGLSNASFVGSMWADFSYMGVIAGPLFVGCFIALSELIISSGRKDVFKVGLHAIVALQVFFLSSRSVTVAMLTGGWGLAIFLALSVGFVLRQLNRSPRIVAPALDAEG